MRNKRFFEAIFDNWPAKIISLAVALVFFLFYRIINLEERFFNVPLEIEVPEQFDPAGDYPKYVRIKLRGTEEDIFRILEEDIRAWIDMSEYRTEGEYKEPVQIIKGESALAAESIEITVEPAEVILTLERTIQKSLEVVPTIIGYPAKGYELNQFFITPSTVELKGPASIIGGMLNVPTGDIDLSGKTETFTTRVSLQIGENIEIVSGEKLVEFHGIIQERVVVETFEPVDIITLDLEPELYIENQIESGLIQVQGTQNRIHDLEPGQMRLEIDCSGIAYPGTYTLPVKPDVPLGMLVLNYRPQNVTYVVYRAEEEVIE